MKKILILIILCVLLTSCAAGNYFGGAGKIYYGDTGFVHKKDASEKGQKMDESCWGFHSV